MANPTGGDERPLVAEYVVPMTRQWSDEGQPSTDTTCPVGKGERVHVAPPSVVLTSISFADASLDRIR